MLKSDIYSVIIYLKLSLVHSNSIFVICNKIQILTGNIKMFYTVSDIKVSGNVIAFVIYVEFHFDKVVMEFNTLRPRQNGRHFPGDIFKCIFLNENV